MTHPALLLCALLLAAPALAQAPVVAAPDAAVQETPAQSSIALRLEPPGGGEAREYALDDMSLSATRSVDIRGESRPEISLSLGGMRPMDAFLLEWARPGEAGPAASRRAVIVVSTPQPSGPAAEIRYEAEGARVIAFSVSHSAAGGSQAAIQVSARQISVNGVALN